MKTTKSAKAVTKASPVKKATKALDRYTTEVGEYNGNPTIKITDTEAKNPRYADFTFGLGKAKMILACIDDIQAFVNINEAKKAKST